MSSTPEVKVETKLPGVLSDRIVAFSPEQFDTMKNIEQKKIEALEKQLGVYQTNIEKLINQFSPQIAKTEAKPSSVVVDAPKAISKNEAAAKSVSDWVKSVDNTGHKTFSLDKSEYLQNKGYQLNALGQIIGLKTEAFTVGTQPIEYRRNAIIIPGGQLAIPIRQYCNFVPLSGADRAAWYTATTFAFGAITEGSEPSESASTFTQVTAVPTTRGSFIKIKYSTLEDNPFDPVSFANEVAMRAAVDGETTEVINTVTVAATPNTGHWINGNSGTAITAAAGTSGNDDVASMTLTLTGVSTAKNLLDVQGYANYGYPYVLGLHPKNYNELVISSGISTFAQQGIPEITRTGILQSLLGVQLVQYDQVYAMDNTTNDTYQNILFVPQQTYGLAAAREFTVKAEEHSELQQLYYTATHRIKASILDNKSWVRLSCKQ